jgi:CRP-like cAMP-binding protein
MTFAMGGKPTFAGWTESRATSNPNQMGTIEHNGGRQTTFPIHPLIAKLSTVTALSEDDRRAILDLSLNSREVPRHRDIIPEGARPDHVHLMIEGWAARYKTLKDGTRQITALLLPGDFCDIHVKVLGRMDHAIAALTNTKVAYIPHPLIDALTARPDLTRALWWATLVDEAVLREWIVNVGRRDAYQAMGHFFCELDVRLRRVGLVEGDKFDLPLTQETIADALGLTSVHVNRVLQRLRAEGIIELGNGKLTILDADRLKKESGFDPTYLHAQSRV